MSYIPNGYLGKLKVTAFAVIYRSLLEGEFTSLAEEYDDESSKSKIRTDRKFPLSVSLKHYHIYDNGNDKKASSLHSGI